MLSQQLLLSGFRKSDFTVSRDYTDVIMLCLVGEMCPHSRTYSGFITFA